MSFDDVARLNSHSSSGWKAIQRIALAAPPAAAHRALTSTLSISALVNRPKEIVTRKLTTAMIAPASRVVVRCDFLENSSTITGPQRMDISAMENMPFTVEA